MPADVNIYAPESAGTEGQVPVSGGEGNAPSWVDQSVLKVGRAQKLGDGASLYSVGSESNPVYVEDGVVKACTSIAANNVPITNLDNGDNATVSFKLGLGNNTFTKTVNHVAEATHSASSNYATQAAYAEDAADAERAVEAQTAGKAPLYKYRVVMQYDTRQGTYTAQFIFYTPQEIADNTLSTIVQYLEVGQCCALEKETSSEVYRGTGFIATAPSASLGVNVFGVAGSTGNATAITVSFTNILRVVKTTM